MSRLAKSRIHAIRPAGGRTADLAGIGSGTPVLTLDGELPVEHLAPGDRIVTRNGARTLRRITARQVRGGFVIAPRALGADRPEAEVAVGAAQKLFLRDWRARAFCEADEGEVPAGRLADGEFIRPDSRTMRLWRLEFDGPEVIYAGGLELAIPAPEPAAI